MVNQISRVCLAAAASIVFVSACTSATSEVSESDGFVIGTVTEAPQRHSASIVVDAPAGAVFDYVADSENWVAWFEPYQSVAVSEDLSQRTFTFVDGATTLTESIVSRNRPESFAWAFTSTNPLGVVDHIGVLQLSELDTGTRVTLVTHYDHPQPDAVASQFEGGAQVILGAITDAFE